MMIYDVILFWPLLDQVPAMSYIHHIASDRVPALKSCHHKYQKKTLRKIAPLRSSTSGLTTWSESLCPWLSQGFSYSTETIFCVECSQSSNDATEDLPWKVTGKGKLVERENQKKECSICDIPWSLCLNCQ